MKELREMQTVEEVDDLIGEIGRDMPGLRYYAEAGKFSAKDRAESPKLDAMCKALERRAEIAGQNGHSCDQNCGPSFTAS